LKAISELAFLEYIHARQNVRNAGRSDALLSIHGNLDIPTSVQPLTHHAFFSSDRVTSNVFFSDLA
jgi:hypothetical protein